MAALPPRTQVKLSRRAPVQLDGLTLEPDVQLMLAMMERRSDPPIETLPPPVARKVVRRQSEVFAGREIPVGEVSDIEVDGGDGPIRARHYAPAEPGGPHPLIVYYH